MVTGFLSVSALPAQSTPLPQAAQNLSQNLSLNKIPFTQMLLVQMAKNGAESSFKTAQLSFSGPGLGQTSLQFIPLTAATAASQSTNSQLLSNNTSGNANSSGEKNRRKTKRKPFLS